jgi:hypothetical protein
MRFSRLPTNQKWLTSFVLRQLDCLINSEVRFMFPDLTVGLISVLTDIVWRITVTWHAGNFCCKLIRFFQVGTPLFYWYALKYNIQNISAPKVYTWTLDCSSFTHSVTWITVDFLSYFALYILLYLNNYNSYY